MPMKKTLQTSHTSTGFTMSGSSTASSSPLLTSPVSGGDDGGSRWMEEHGFNTGHHADLMNTEEDSPYEQTEYAEASMAGDSASARHRGNVPANCVQTSPMEGASSRAEPTSIDLTRGLPNRPMKDRKRRLTSTGEHARPQRTRSGGGSGADVNARGAFPHRSVSMAVPSSRDVPSGEPGSSYATAIDIPSSPDQFLRSSLGHGEEETAQRGHPGADGRWLTYARDRDSSFSGAGRFRANNDQEVGDLHDLTLPRWQPDAEVSSCPICGTVFSFWYRKHHCRKCGRVVCASCSPHRITIPRQYIVRPPDSTTLPTSSPIPPLHQVVDLTGEEPVPLYPVINPALGGGEEVRLCNPCVPDPNPNPLGYSTSRSHGHRSTHSLSSTMGHNYSQELGGNRAARQERRTLGAHDRPSFLHEIGQNVRQSMYDTPPDLGYQGLERRRARRATAQSEANPPNVISPSGISSSGVSSPRQPLPSSQAPFSQSPGRPAIPEEDLCPICRRHFPPISTDQPLESREAHIRHCIESFGAPPPQPAWSIRRGPVPPRPRPPVARMLEFTATEKDCLGADGGVAECTICMEDYEVGQPLARLGCLCKFHKACIADWFERKMECPVHKVAY